MALFRGGREMARSSTPTGSLIALNPFDLSSREFDLHKDHILIGSDPTNDLVISEDTVSRHHASITCREARYELADLNSTNGTFVNGQRLTSSTWIDKGDQVRFGEARFVFSTSGVSSTSAVGKPTRVATMKAHALTVALALVAGLVGGFLSARLNANINTQSIAANQFVLVDQGKPRAALNMAPFAPGQSARTPALGLIDESGHPRLFLTLMPDGTGLVLFRGQPGRIVMLSDDGRVAQSWRSVRFSREQPDV
jgi:FHA domain-containing protein